MRHRDRKIEERRKLIRQSFAHRMHHPRLAQVVERNIATIIDLRAELCRDRSLQDRLADVITTWFGSMSFVALHVVWFAAWIIINLELTPLKPFDPFPFGLLTMVVSLEAIFLATFVLISQNRTAEMDAQRNDLDLQVDLLAEYELTRVLSLVDAIADHFDLQVAKDPELDELKRDVAPEAVLKEMHDRQQENGRENGKKKRAEPH